LAAHEEQAPALHEHGRSTPSSSAWSRMKTSSGHLNSFSPSGVISFPVCVAPLPPHVLPGLLLSQKEP